MYLLGHIGFTLFAGFLYEKARNTDLGSKKLFLAFGSMFPDLIDKPLGLIFSMHGRSIGHSLLGLLVFFLLGSVSIRALEFQSFSIFKLKLILVGSLFHLLEDGPLGINVLLYPFFGELPMGKGEDFLLSFNTSKTIISEILGSLFILIVGIYENWDRSTWIKIIISVILYLVTFVIAYVILIG